MNHEAINGGYVRLRDAPEGRRLWYATPNAESDGVDWLAIDLTTDDIKRMVEALEHYANKERWDDLDGRYRHARIFRGEAAHGWDIATKALKSE